MPNDNDKLLSIGNREILLDTNILIRASTAKREEQRMLLQQFSKQNTVFISDTVYYEFLRHTNIENFRKKRALLTTLLHPEVMKDDRVLREDDRVQRTFECLWALYLYIMRSEPKRVIHMNIQDLWIAAASIYYRIDTILTTDHRTSDFADELFEDQEFDLGDNLVLHLKKFRRERAQNLWREMKRENVIPVDCRSIK